MKKSFLLLLLTIAITFNVLAQTSKTFYNDGVYTKFNYTGTASKATNIFVSGKKQGSDKLVWLKTQASASSEVTLSGKPMSKYEIKDENNIRYYLYIAPDFSSVQLYKLNNNGDITIRWILKERINSPVTTLTFGGNYNVKFDYDKKTRKMFNLQFSSNENKTSWNKFEVYDIADYSDGGFDGKEYTVKDGKNKKFTILYSDSFDYILVTPVGSSGNAVTLNLIK